MSVAIALKHLHLSVLFLPHLVHIFIILILFQDISVRARNDTQGNKACLWKFRVLKFTHNLGRQYLPETPTSNLIRNNLCNKNVSIFIFFDQFYTSSKDLLSKIAQKWQLSALEWSCPPNPVPHFWTIGLQESCLTSLCIIFPTCKMRILFSAS